MGQVADIDNFVPVWNEKSGQASESGSFSVVFLSAAIFDLKVRIQEWHNTINAALECRVAIAIWYDQLIV